VLVSREVVLVVVLLVSLADAVVEVVFSLVEDLVVALELVSAGAASVKTNVMCFKWTSNCLKISTCKNISMDCYMKWTSQK